MGLIEGDPFYEFLLRVCLRHFLKTHVVFGQGKGESYIKKL